MYMYMPFHGPTHTHKYTCVSYNSFAITYMYVYMYKYKQCSVLPACKCIRHSDIVNLEVKRSWENCGEGKFLKI